MEAPVDGLQPDKVRPFTTKGWKNCAANLHVLGKVNLIQISFLTIFSLTGGGGGG